MIEEKKIKFSKKKLFNEFKIFLNNNICIVKLICRLFTTYVTITNSIPKSPSVLKDLHFPIHNFPLESSLACALWSPLPEVVLELAGPTALQALLRHKKLHFMARALLTNKKNCIRGLLRYTITVTSSKMSINITVICEEIVQCSNIHAQGRKYYNITCKHITLF